MSTDIVVKSRPLLMSGPMVRASLAGLKDRTRRIVDFSNSSASGARNKAFWASLDFNHPDNFVDGRGGPDEYLHVRRPVDGTTHRVRCEIDSGSRLWVREAWSIEDQDGDGECYAVAYAADGPQGDVSWPKVPKCDRGKYGLGHNIGRPSIHMPRWACRLTLAVVSVRVERVQDITEADAIAEGIRQVARVGDKPGEFWWGTEMIPSNYGGDDLRRLIHEHTPEQAFAALWDSINGPGAWARNDWVWVIAFRRVGVTP